jgi:hypothetical protein
MFKQRTDLPLSSVLFGRCGLCEPTKQSHSSSYDLTCPGEVWESIIVLDDPSVHVVGPVARGSAGDE